MRLTYTQIALLQACARGPRQLSLINELIGNGLTVARTFKYIPSTNYRGYAAIYGETELPHNSWIALRDRLIASGFTDRSEGKWFDDGWVIIGLGAHK